MPQLGRFVDSRDGHIYRTVLMPDGKWWSAEDLVWAGSGATGDYGRLYTYDQALVAVPSGTHLPSYTEINTMIAACGGTAYAGTALKSATSWTAYSGIPTGTDLYGLNIKPSGYKASTGTSIQRSGLRSYWWSSISVDGTSAYRFSVSHNSESTTVVSDVKTDLYAVHFIVDSGNIPDPTECAPVTYSPPAGTYGTPQTVALSTETAGASIYYTVDGSEPVPPDLATTGTVVDARDGTQYRVVRMPDGRMWGTTPLSYVTADSKPVNNDEANTALHGRLYRKADAVANVPAGCAIPARATILTMLNALGLGTVVNGGPINADICAALLHADDGGSDLFGFGLRRSGRWLTGYREFGELGWFFARDNFDPDTYHAHISYNPSYNPSYFGGFSKFTADTNWVTTRFIVIDESVIAFDTTAPIYTAPLTISESTTVKAIAVKAGLDDSAVTSALYTIPPPVAHVLFGAPFQGFERGYSLEISRKISEIQTLGSAPILLPYAPADKDEWIVDAELWVTAAQAAEIQARVPPKGSPLERAIGVPPRSGANTFAGLAPANAGDSADTYLDPVVLSLESLGQKAVAVDLYGFRIRFSLSCSSISNPYSSNPATPPTATPPSWLNQKFRVHQIEDCSVEERVIAPSGKWSASPNPIKAGRGLPLSIALDYLTQERADELVAFFRGIRGNAFAAPLDFPGATSTSFVARKLSLTRPGPHWEGMLEVYQA